MNNLQKGEYGRFHFTLKAKGKSTGFNLCATIVEFDGKRVFLRDNDDLEYMPKRSDVDMFERAEIPAEYTSK